MPAAILRLFQVLLSSFLLACVAASSVRGDGDDRDKESEQKHLSHLQGTWAGVAAEHDGKDATHHYKDELGLRIEFQNDVWVYRTSGRPSWGTAKNSVVKLFPSDSPKGIDHIVTVDGVQVVARGIYELDGDELKICLTNGGPQRPTEFRTVGHDNWWLVTFRRVDQGE